MKVVIDGKEYIEKEKIENLIYNLPIFGFEEDQFKAIEKALGFKLFKWQKTYILHGSFRQTGRTTAECLRLLLDVDNVPIDFSMPSRSIKEDFFKSCLKEIQERLMAFGIPTRAIFWSKTDKEFYQEKSRIYLKGTDVFSEEVNGLRKE